LKTDGILDGAEDRLMTLSAPSSSAPNWTRVYLDGFKGMEPDEQRAKVRDDLETRPSSG
jgi:hypothetical protein